MSGKGNIILTFSGLTRLFVVIISVLDRLIEYITVIVKRHIINSIRTKQKIKRIMCIQDLMQQNQIFIFTVFHICFYK